MNPTMPMSEGTLTVACIQNCAVKDTESGLTEATALAREARNSGAELICFPEFCHQLFIDGDTFETGAAPQDSHPALLRMQGLARELNVWLLVGSLAIRGDSGKDHNRSFLIDSHGTIIAHYDKIHMFDVTLGNGETYRESARFEPGKKAVVADMPWGGIGLTVCYDLRFASLYRSLAQHGASMITVPAAFTHTTGKAHWHVLLKSRAIETGSYIIAPCQYGTHGKARTYGHSLIVDPWGEIIAEAGEQAATIAATLDLSRVADARQRIPSLEHDRPFSF